MTLGKDLLFVVHDKVSSRMVRLEQLQKLDCDGGRKRFAQQVARIEIEVLLAVGEVFSTLVKLGELPPVLVTLSVVPLRVVRIEV